MARPITWQNINSRSNTGAARIMESGEDSINAGFGMFNKLIDDTQQVRTDNRDQTIDNNTQSFLNRLQGIQDPEEMARLQASGELQQMREGFGGMIDQDATRGAVDDRLTGLREMQTTNREYQDSETRFANRDERDAYGVALAEGRFGDAEAIREANDFLDEGQMVRQQTTAEQNLEQLNYTREQRANSREDRARLEREREADKAQRELKNQTYARFTAPLKDGETFTTRKQDLNEFMKSDQFKWMAPAKRTAYKQQALKDLEFGEAIAAGDQTKIDKYVEPVKRDLERNTFYAHENREGDDGTRTRNIIENYVEENGDEGIGMLMGEADGDDRMKIIQGVQAALGGRTPNGEVLLEGGIPESYIRTALDGVRGGNIINFDTAFADQLEDVISSKAFKQDYESYASLESRYNQMKSDAQSAARNGAVSTNSTQASQETQQSGGTQRPDVPRPTPDTRGVTAPNTPGLNPRGPSIKPDLPTGDTASQPGAEPQNNGSPIPKPQMNEVDDVGFNTPMRDFIPNMFNRLKNTLKNQQYEGQQNTFEEMTSIMGSGDIGPSEKGRLSELLRTNPSMLQFMSPEQRNNMRNILGEGMINTFLKQTE